MGYDGIVIKQPTVRERALRRLLPLGVSLAMAASLAASPAVAFADETAHEYEEATVTIAQPNKVANEGATYDAYKIFDADIDNQNTATHIEWASDAAKTTTLAFLNGLTGDESYAAWLANSGYDQQGADENPRNAAEFIAYMIANDTDNTWFGGVPAAKMGGSFTDRFARAVQASDIAKTTSTSNGSTDSVISGTEGYYLVVTTADTIGEGESGSAPMWIPLGGSMARVQSKESPTTMTFKVKEDSTDQSGSVADANVGQNCSFSVVASYPRNVHSYSSFSDTLTFTFPEGMATSSHDELVAGDFSVLFNGQVPDDRFPGGRGVMTNIEHAPGVSVTVEGSQVTVHIENVEAAMANMRLVYPDVQLTNIGVSFAAHLESDATVGAEGNEVTVVRTYTKDPVSLTMTNSETLSTKLFTYQAQITKIDKASQTPLEGAGFYIAADTNYTRNDDTYYVQADGSLSRTPYEFFTGEDGTFLMSGIDEGVYTIHENTVPDNYAAPDADTELTITASHDDAAQTVGFDASVTGGEAVVSDGDAATMLTGQDAAAGKALVQIVNEKEFAMPYTGLKGNTGLYAIAATLGLGGAAATYAGVRRKRKEEQGA